MDIAVPILRIGIENTLSKAHRCPGRTLVNLAIKMSGGGKIIVMSSTLSAVEWGIYKGEVKLSFESPCLIEPAGDS